MFMSKYRLIPITTADVHINMNNTHVLVNQIKFTLPTMYELGVAESSRVKIFINNSHIKMSNAKLQQWLTYFSIVLASQLKKTKYTQSLMTLRKILKFHSKHVFLPHQLSLFTFIELVKFLLISNTVGVSDTPFCLLLRSQKKWYELFHNVHAIKQLGYSRMQLIQRIVLLQISLTTQQSLTTNALMIRSLHHKRFILCSQRVSM